MTEPQTFTGTGSASLADDLGDDSLPAPAPQVFTGTAEIVLTDEELEALYLAIVPLDQQIPLPKE